MALVVTCCSLSPLQQELLSALAAVGPASLAAIRGRLREETAERTIQENLAMLRTLGLADSAGRGRGARWMLKGRRE
jgi:ATP-dependent DNA helicase RecG